MTEKCRLFKMLGQKNEKRVHIDIVKRIMKSNVKKESLMKPWRSLTLIVNC